MDWETVSAISEFVAAIAVVASLLYLAIQVRDSKNSTLSATHYQITESLNSIFLNIAQDADLSRIYMQGNRDPSTLTRDEFPRYMTLVGGIFARYNNYFMQHEKGTLDDEPLEIAKVHIKSLMSAPGIQMCWRRSRQQYLRVMKEFLDRTLEEMSDTTAASGQNERA